MKRSPLVRLLALAAFVPLALALVAPPSSADSPELSQDCQSRHDAVNSQVSSQAGSILISASFNAGEQLSFASQFAASVDVTSPGGATTLAVAAGDTLRYDVTTTGAYTFHFTGQPQGTPVVLRLGCGIPPRAVITAPAEGATYGVNDVVSPQFSCVPGTDAATCSAEVPGPVDTSTAGPHSYTVVASDSADLQTRTTVHYTVAKKPQTLHFTTAPPTDAIVGFRYDYEVDAASTSGLPVTLTSDPTTPACQISPYGGGPIYGNVSAVHAGTCRIFADQPGNEEYLPAERITMTFEIARELTTLDAAKASKGLLGISGTTFSADLHRRGWFGPGYGAMFAFPGQTVKFYVGGKLICSAVTQVKDDGTFFRGGVATCKAPIGVQAALKYNSYTAVYEGERDSLPSTAVGKLQ